MTDESVKKGYKYSGKSIDYPEPSLEDKRPIGSSPTSNKSQKQKNGEAQAQSQEALRKLNDSSADKPNKEEKR